MLACAAIVRGCTKANDRAESCQPRPLEAHDGGVTPEHASRHLHLAIAIALMREITDPNMIAPLRLGLNLGCFGGNTKSEEGLHGKTLQRVWMPRLGRNDGRGQSTGHNAVHSSGLLQMIQRTQPHYFTGARLTETNTPVSGALPE
jgi:hypothetical protein